MLSTLICDCRETIWLFQKMLMDDVLVMGSAILSVSTSVEQQCFLHVYVFIIGAEHE